jgi:CheY-like chemotaxis protein
MSKLVLLSDDEVHILRAAEFKLKRAGFEVRCASDGQEAWEMIQDRCPDILITDCQMPRLDGLQLARLVRDNPNTRDLPIVMLTAKGFELTYAELADKLGIAALLSKPFSPREILRCVEQVLETGAYQPPSMVL